MSLDRLIDSIIKEAMERGEFENLSGQGKSIDLTAYFNTPEEVRVVYSVLKNAGILPREAELLKEISDLKQALAACGDDKKQKSIKKQIEQKQVEINLIMEHSRRIGKKS